MKLTRQAAQSMTVKRPTSNLLQLPQENKELSSEEEEVKETQITFKIESAEKITIKSYKQLLDLSCSSTAMSY